ncbi:hypothetical protein [Subsaximicrobium wynnwilliamsii]|nr:hypothetical protein [Subsaximicrobium wynnwilliamsii]
MCLLNVTIITVDNFDLNFDIKNPTFVASLGVLNNNQSLEIETN